MQSRLRLRDDSLTHSRSRKRLCKYAMYCPACGHPNPPGSDECGNCRLSLAHLDEPALHDRVERSLMTDPVTVLGPREPVTVAADANLGQAIRQMIDRVKPACELEVDGGIEPHTAPAAVEAGARVLVAGSAIFMAKEGIAAAMDRLRGNAK